MRVILSAMALVLAFCAVSTSAPSFAQPAAAELPTIVAKLIDRKFIGPHPLGFDDPADFSLTRRPDGKMQLARKHAWKWVFTLDGANHLSGTFSQNAGGGCKASATQFTDYALRLDISCWKTSKYLVLDERGDLHFFDENLKCYSKFFANASDAPSVSPSICQKKEATRMLAATGLPLERWSELIASNQPFHTPGAQTTAQAAPAAVAIATTPVNTAPTNVAAPMALNSTIGAPRLALVIGNGAYGPALGRLANPVNDANTVAAALRRSGFDVTVAVDTDQRTMKRAIAAFGQRLSAAGRGATGLFYYAGHGVQSRGVNYLVPVNAAIDSEADVDIEAVAADGVLRQMEEAGAATSIVILDACRNLPIARSSRDGSRGLARMEAPNGSFVAYSTAPGSVAADGSGANSPFASALVAEMARPGQQIEITFKNVRRAVMAGSGGKQTPWDSSSLVESFTFTPE